MSKINHEYIENYIRNFIVESDPLLAKLEAYAEENHVPIIHPEVKRLLTVIIRSSGIKRILEVGTAIGYSAISFAKISDQITVDTMELSEEMISIAKINIEAAGLSNRISIIPGDATITISEIEGEYDCIFLDGAKGHYVHMLDDCLKLLKPGGLLISDNVLFRGMIASDELVKRRKITIVKRMRKYLEEISDRPMLETSIIPIGDGLAVSYYKGD